MTKFEILETPTSFVSSLHLHSIHPRLFFCFFIYFFSGFFYFSSLTPTPFPPLQLRLPHSNILFLSPHHPIVTHPTFITPPTYPALITPPTHPALITPPPTHSALITHSSITNSSTTHHLIITLPPLTTDEGGEERLDGHLYPGQCDVSQMTSQQRTLPLC